jgi:hypothetical protein
MATLKTDIALKQSDPLILTAQRQDDGARTSGDVLVATGIYTFTGAEANGDIIDIAELPEGATVLPTLSGYATKFAGDADIDIEIGDNDDTIAADAVRYCAKQTSDKSVATQFGFVGGTAAANPYTLQRNSFVQAKLSGLGTVAAGDKIAFYVFYRAQS